MFPITSSKLSTDTLIQDVLSLYRINAPISCDLLNAGINDSYLVTAGTDKYILRVYTRGEHTLAEIEAELLILTVLSRCDITTAEPIARQDGQLVTTVEAPEGKRCIVLFQYLDGQKKEALTPGDHHLIGATLAQMHELLDLNMPPVDRPVHNSATMLVEPLATILGFEVLPLTEEHRTLLRTIVDRLKPELDALPTDPPAFGLCHGDFMSGNLLFNNGSIGIIDFDICAYCWRIYDLATFVWLRALGESDIPTIMQDVLEPLVRGYETLRPLSEAERQLLPYFVLVRHIWLIGASGIPRSSRFGIGWLLNEKEKFMSLAAHWAEFLGIA